MDGEEEVPVGLGADEVTRGVIRQDDHVGPGLDLGPGKGDRHLLEPVQEPAHLVGFDQDPEEKLLDPGQMVRDRPGSHHLSDDAVTVAVTAAQDLNGLEEDLHGRLLQEVFRDLQVFHLPDRMGLGVGHHGPRSPVDLAAERLGLLVDAELGHDRVEPQDLDGPRGKIGHLHRIEVGFREGDAHLVHEFLGDDGRGTGDGNAVPLLSSEEAREKTALGCGRDGRCHDSLLTREADRPLRRPGRRRRRSRLRRSRRRRSGSPERLPR